VALYLVANSNRTTQQHIEALYRSRLRDHDHVHTAVKKIIELSQTDFIHQHLQKHGVLPYVAVAGDRIDADIAAIKLHLECNDAEAIQYLKTGSIHGASPRAERDGGPPLEPEAAG
jgi:hypothetical protein